MGGEKRIGLTLSLLLFSLLTTSTSSIRLSPSSSTKDVFTPFDNILLDCGSSKDTLLQDGRLFKSDKDSIFHLSKDDDVKISTASVPPSSSYHSSALYRTAQIFPAKVSFQFNLSRPGTHWIRLHFHPLPHPSYRLTNAVFSVHTESAVLLDNFSVQDNSTYILKEYIIRILSKRFTLAFSPQKKSFAFINAIEIITLPEDLILDSATSVFPAGIFKGLTKSDFEVSYRFNIGGMTVTPKNDTLSRMWVSDKGYQKFPEGAQSESVSPDAVKYPEIGLTKLTAPSLVYATGQSMTESANTAVPKYNLTWSMIVDPEFSYLIRMHFCNIVSNPHNDLSLDVFINGFTAVSGLNVSSLRVPFFQDFTLNASASTNGSIIVQIRPSESDNTRHLKTAILNGLEVLKIINTAGSLDGLFITFNWWNVVVLVMLAVIVVVLAMVLSTQLKKARQMRPSDDFDSRRLRGFFSLLELQDATDNFNEKKEIGVGGFGKVYFGVLKDKTRVAIKRGNPGSQQVMSEFKNEIEVLAAIRHRNIASLIGFCDEDSELILVYEYMENGSLNNVLYGSTFPPLSWTQRLNVCIDAAHGLHYLHTGPKQGPVIHRDMKTSNILLDENLLAKVSDFGLSKAVSSVDFSHVTTAVRGTSGYLDPEYHQSKRLTLQSDIYSFGVVLLEVLCGRAAETLEIEEASLAALVISKQEKIQEIMDKHIADAASRGSLDLFVRTVIDCLSEYGEYRPKVGGVLQNLESCLRMEEKIDDEDFSETEPIDEAEDSEAAEALLLTTS